MSDAKPGVRPVIPHFSSGPCAKRPGWNLQALTDAALGRSHRAKLGKAKLKRAIDLTREVLEVPADYRIGIVPASDTGAVEMALWSLLGARPWFHLPLVANRLSRLAHSLTDRSVH
jgi:phosphoserine aminotransferase